MILSNTSNNSASNLQDYINSLWVIDTHEHFTDITSQNDPVLFILDNYYVQTDIQLLDHGITDIQTMLTTSISLSSRFELLIKCLRSISNTGYYRAMANSLSIICDINPAETLTMDLLPLLQSYLDKRNTGIIQAEMNRLQIKSFIANPDISLFRNGRVQSAFTNCQYAFPLPPFHCFRSYDMFAALPCVLGNQQITTLHDYMEVFEKYLADAVKKGAICIKDQSAYMRTLNFTKPDTNAAEKAFKKILQSGNQECELQEMLPLSNWLMHQFMKLAAKYNLPVQLHTGHLAFPYSDIRSSNAIMLSELLASHQDVKFILFHGNWPFADDLLFLLKNYPNTYLDLCWVQSIDPLYAISLMQRTLLTIPINKVCAFGGDTSIPEWTYGYLKQAKENLGAALTGLINHSYITESQARQIAEKWLYGNAANIYRLP